jgi:hypothetical protein
MDSQKLFDYVVSLIPEVKVKDLELTTRTFNALTVRAQPPIEVVGEMSSARVLAIRNFGRLQFRELREVVWERAKPTREWLVLIEVRETLMALVDMLTENEEKAKRTSEHIIGNCLEGVLAKIERVLP